ncbi:MAG TPA: ATP-binding cassette domain-containing protein, partial [Nocardioides sp.]
QSARLFPSMTVRQILLTATMLRESGAAARALADQVLEEVGLAEQGDRRPNELSLPQRQMVELGKCVALQPKMIMLDEIMGGLNRVECGLPIAAIERLRDRGMTFLLVEHVMPIVMSLADQIVVLDFGRRIATGTPSEIVENKAVQESYLGGVDDSLEA